METHNEFNVESLPQKKWWEQRYVCEMNGFWTLPEFVPYAVRVLNEFKPLPSDVILASFPKTGTTWLKSLLPSIIWRSSKESSSLVNHHPHDLVRYLEFPGSPPWLSSSSPNGELISSSSSGGNHHHDEEITDPTRRRIFATHLPYQHLENKLDTNKPCRVVYITRNPKDTLVSMWHFVNKTKGPEEHDWQLEDAQNTFCSGIFPFGPYYDHVMGFKKASLEKPHNIFFITYEELMTDPIVHVKRLAEFLGCPFADDQEESVLEVEKIVKSCSFESMTSQEVNKSEDFTSWTPVAYNAFFRKGGIGDHKNYLDANTIKRIDALTREKFHAAGFMYGI
ncbi:cytosolic sulfotransferase 5 [Capsicum chacoense]